jgi:hypothetical protein
MMAPPAMPAPPTADPAPTCHDPERALLLACLWARYDEGAAGTVRRLAGQPLDVERLLALAARQRLHAVVARALRDAGVALPAVTREALDEVATGAALHGLRMAHALVRVLRLLEAAGIHPVAFKGPAMAAALYGDLGLRPCGDLDLLVRPEEQLPARDVLVAAGFRPDPPMSPAVERAHLAEGFAYSFYDDASGVKVDLHATLVHHTFGFAPDLDVLRGRAVEVSLAGQRVRTLAPEDLLLFLCIHGAKHEWRQLVWVADVAELIRAHPGLDWAAIVDAAGEARARRMLALGLFLASGLPRVRLPEAVAPLLVDPALPALAQEVVRRMAAPAEARASLLRQIRFHMCVREARADQAGQLYEKVRDGVRHTVQNARVLVRPSDKDRAFVTLPRRWAWVYFFVRPVRVLADRAGLRSAAGAPCHETGV